MPDCKTCYFRDVCDQYQEGTYCVEWRGAAPPKRDPQNSPSARWLRGEISELDEGAGE